MELRELFTPTKLISFKSIFQSIIRWKLLRCFRSYKLLGFLCVGWFCFREIFTFNCEKIGLKKSVWFFNFMYDWELLQVIFLHPVPLHPHIYSNGHICLGKNLNSLYFNLQWTTHTVFVWGNEIWLVRSIILARKTSEYGVTIAIY